MEEQPFESDSATNSIKNDFQEAHDWTYSKRREMQEIVKGLFLGPYSVAVRSKVTFLHIQHYLYLIFVFS